MSDHFCHQLSQIILEKGAENCCCFSKLINISVGCIKSHQYRSPFTDILLTNRNKKKTSHSEFANLVGQSPIRSILAGGFRPVNFDTIVTNQQQLSNRALKARFVQYNILQSTFA